MYNKDQLKWIIFFRKMAQGKIPHQTKFYCVDKCVTENEINDEYQKGDGVEPKIELITPTQQLMAQARAEVKRNLEEAALKQSKKRKTMCF